MKRRELEAHLRDADCAPLQPAANHTIWANPLRDLRAPVPRHREIPAGTVRAICRQLGVAAPPNPR